MEKTSTMKQAGTSVLVALALICVVSCAKIDDESSAVAPEQPARPTVLLPTRSYEEALSLARKSIALVDRGQTRSATARSIRSERGQCVTTPSTRSGAGSDTLMYVFNFENNDGFSVIAANRAVDPVLAVAEKGNYTYGEPTGVELPEVVGTRANRETKAELYAGDQAIWYGADVIQAAIGQSDNKFTPMQMVCYTSALANNGTRYNATFLSRVISWDYQELIMQHEPTVASELDISDEAIDCYKTGMKLVASQGTAAQYLATYPVSVACKTGTAQWGNMHSGSDHASFVLYAPADDPEIAIAVYVEKGAQGGNLANVCIPIMNAYFSASSSHELALRENTAN